MPKQKKENNVLYNGTDTWVNQRTGEIIEASEVIKKVNRNGFMITYLATILNLMDCLGTKKLQVVKFLLNEMDKSNNIITLTTREIASKCNVAKQTVTETLKALEETNIITRKPGVIMISPKLLHRGTKNKEAMLLTRFQEIASDSNEN